MSPILIERIQTIIVDLPTIRPHKLAMHTMQQQTLVVLRVRCSDGVEGIGEATTIGGLAYVSGTQLQTPLTIACIIVIGLAAVGLDALIAAVGRVATPWQGRA